MTLAFVQRRVVDRAAAGRPVDAWHWGRRVGFLFVFVFVLLMALPFPFGAFGIPAPVGRWWQTLWMPIVPWVAKHILPSGHDFPGTGGGETTWYYVQVGTAGAIALVVALIWASLDRGRTDLRRLDALFRVYLRIFLAAVLFSYCWSKILPVQFPALGPERLSETFGEASANGFLWAFMGDTRRHIWHSAGLERSLRDFSCAFVARRPSEPLLA